MPVGQRLVRRNKYGIDPFDDVRRLAGREIKVIFDVGANNGETALRALSAFPTAKVISFEPHPETFAALIQAVVSNRFRAANVALDSTSGKRELFVYDQPEVN